MSRLDAFRGIYDASRASALSGVPTSTIYYWARNDVLNPSVSANPRTKLWSWNDLLLLRMVHWLRQDKSDLARATSMPEVRRFLAELPTFTDRIDLALETVMVSRLGHIFVKERQAMRAVASGQAALQDILDLIGPYGQGLDLLLPAEGIRILPGKLSGEPHIEGTRIATRAVYALLRAGYAASAIVELFPELTAEAAERAIALERRLMAA